MNNNLAVVAFAKEDLRVISCAEPSPSSNEAVVEVAYGGICGSDLHYVSHGAAGASILIDPLILGHEVVGTVITQASDGSGPRVGTKVAVHPGLPHAVPGIRWPEDRPNLAPGSTYLGSAARHPHNDGAFQRRVALPTSMLRQVPSSVSLELAALAEPAAVAWHAANRAERSLEGKRVAVIGLGPIGLLTVAVAKARGASDIIGSDLAEAPRKRALAVGATDVVDARDSEQIETLDADIVFESSGSNPGLHSAIKASTRGGVVVLVGLQRNGLVDVPMALAITREVDLHGSFRFNNEIDDVLAAMGNSELNLDGIVTHTFDAEDAASAFDTARDPAKSGKVLLRF